MGHRVRMKFNTVSGSGGSSGSQQRKFVVHVNASLEECGGHFQGTQGVITRSGILNNNTARSYFFRFVFLKLEKLFL